MAKGVFTPTLLAEIQVKMENVWKDPQYSKFYTPRGETTKAIIENQTAEFPELKDPSKEREIAVKWADWCDDTATTSTNADTCSNGDCDEPDPKTKTYANNTFLEDCYSIREEDYQTSVLDLSDQIAKGQAAKLRNIIELLNTKVIAIADANTGVNPLAGQDPFGVMVDGDTPVMKQNFNIETLYPAWMEMLVMLRSSNNFILDGRNLFQAKILAEAAKLNADGKIDSALFDMFPYYNDLLGFNRADVLNKTYIIDKGAMAVQSRQKWSKAPEPISNDRIRWSMKIPGYPGLGLDVIYQQTCVDGSEIFTWKYKFRGLIAVNPITCDEGNTGIWSFTNVADV